LGHPHNDSHPSPDCLVRSSRGRIARPILSCGSEQTGCATLLRNGVAFLQSDPARIFLSLSLSNLTENAPAIVRVHCECAGPRLPNFLTANIHIRTRAQTVRAYGKSTSTDAMSAAIARRSPLMGSDAKCRRFIRLEAKRRHDFVGQGDLLFGASIRRESSLHRILYCQHPNCVPRTPRVAQNKRNRLCRVDATGVSIGVFPVSVTAGPPGGRFKMSLISVARKKCGSISRAGSLSRAPPDGPKYLRLRNDLRKRKRPEH
jgi:hypothetical protein